jgi:hypothetical protein
VEHWNRHRRCSGRSRNLALAQVARGAQGIAPTTGAVTDINADHTGRAPSHNWVDFLAFENPRRLGDDQMIFVTGANSTHRLIKIEGGGFGIEATGHTIACINLDAMPLLLCVLKETDSVKTWGPIKDIGESLIKNRVHKADQASALFHR